MGRLLQCFCFSPGGNSDLRGREVSVNRPPLGLRKDGEGAAARSTACHGKQDVQSLQAEVQRLEQELCKLRSLVGVRHDSLGLQSHEPSASWVGAHLSGRASTDHRASAEMAAPSVAPGTGGGYLYTFTESNAGAPTASAGINSISLRPYSPAGSGMCAQSSQLQTPQLGSIAGLPDLDPTSNSTGGGGGGGAVTLANIISQACASPPRRSTAQVPNQALNSPSPMPQSSTTGDAPPQPQGGDGHSGCATHTILLRRLQAAYQGMAAPLSLVVFSLDSGLMPCYNSSAQAVVDMLGGPRSPYSTALCGSTLNGDENGGSGQGVSCVKARCVWINDAYQRKLEATSAFEALHLLEQLLSSAGMVSQVEGFCRNIANAAPRPVSFWHPELHTTSKGGLACTWMWPVVLRDEEGTVSGNPGSELSAALLYVEPHVPRQCQYEALLREFMAGQHTPCMMTVLNMNGSIVMQNPESCARIGCHASNLAGVGAGAPWPAGKGADLTLDSSQQVISSGSHVGHSVTSAGVNLTMAELQAGSESNATTTSQVPPQRPAPVVRSSLHAANESLPAPKLMGTASGTRFSTAVAAASAALAVEQPFNYMEELFDGQEGLLAEMLEIVRSGEIFHERMQITSSVLRAWFGLVEGDELWHQVQIATIKDPITHQMLLSVSQVDITDMIEVERQVVQLQQQQSALLREILPQQVIEHLLIHKALQVARAAHKQRGPFNVQQLPSTRSATGQFGTDSSTDPSTGQVGTPYDNVALSTGFTFGMAAYPEAAAQTQVTPNASGTAAGTLIPGLSASADDSPPDAEPHIKTTGAVDVVSGTGSQAAAMNGSTHAPSSIQAAAVASSGVAGGKRPAAVAAGGEAVTGLKPITLPNSGVPFIGLQALPQAGPQSAASSASATRLRGPLLPTTGPMRPQGYNGRPGTSSQAGNSLYSRSSSSVSRLSGRTGPGRLSPGESGLSTMQTDIAFGRASPGDLAGGARSPGGLSGLIAQGGLVGLFSPLSPAVRMSQGGLAFPMSPGGMTGRMSPGGERLSPGSLSTSPGGGGGSPTGPGMDTYLLATMAGRASGLRGSVHRGRDATQISGGSFTGSRHPVLWGPTALSAAANRAGLNRLLAGIGAVGVQAGAPPVASGPAAHGLPATGGGAGKAGTSSATNNSAARAPRTRRHSIPVMPAAMTSGSAAAAWPSLDDVSVLGPWAHALRHTASPYTTRPSSPHSSHVVHSTRSGLATGSTHAGDSVAMLDGSASSPAPPYLMRSCGTGAGNSSAGSAQQLTITHNAFSSCQQPSAQLVHVHAPLVQQSRGGSAARDTREGDASNLAERNMAHSHSMQLAVLEAASSSNSSNIQGALLASNTRIMMSTGTGSSVDILGTGQLRASGMGSGRDPGPQELLLWRTNGLAGANSTHTQRPSTTEVDRLSPAFAAGGALRAGSSTSSSLHGADPSGKRAAPPPLSSAHDQLQVPDRTAPSSNASAPVAAAAPAAAASAAPMGAPLGGPAVPASLPHRLSVNTNPSALPAINLLETNPEILHNALGARPAGSLHAATAPAIPEEPGRIWLTQQDVMNLATYHEEVTILFADIKGFTSLSNQLHPSQVMLFLNSLYSVWDSLLETFGVYKVETIGDSYMAAAGLFCQDPITNVKRLGGHDPQHASKIIAFAKAMLWSSQSIKTPLGETVQVRVGVHSGPCMSGVVGQRMPRFCLFGDSVNTASRMESNGHPGCIHVSHATCDLIPWEPWQATGGILAKGKGVMQTWLLPILPGAMAAAAASLRVTSPSSSLVAGPVAPALKEQSSELQQARGSRSQSASQVHFMHSDELPRVEDMGQLRLEFTGDVFVVDTEPFTEGPLTVSTGHSRQMTATLQHSSSLSSLASRRSAGSVYRSMPDTPDVFERGCGGSGFGKASSLEPVEESPCNTTVLHASLSLLGDGTQAAAGRPTDVLRDTGSFDTALGMSSTCTPAMPGSGTATRTTAAAASPVPSSPSSTAGSSAGQVVDSLGSHLSAPAFHTQHRLHANTGTASGAALHAAAVAAAAAAADACVGPACGNAALQAGLVGSSAPDSTTGARANTHSSSKLPNLVAAGLTQEESDALLFGIRPCDPQGQLMAMDSCDDGTTCTTTTNANSPLNTHPDGLTASEDVDEGGRYVGAFALNITPPGRHGQAAASAALQHASATRNGRASARTSSEVQQAQRRSHEQVMRGCSSLEILRTSSAVLRTTSTMSTAMRSGDVSDATLDRAGTGLSIVSSSQAGQASDAQGSSSQLPAAWHASALYAAATPTTRRRPQPTPTQSAAAAARLAAGQMPGSPHKAQSTGLQDVAAAQWSGAGSEPAASVAAGTSSVNCTPRLSVESTSSVGGPSASPPGGVNGGDAHTMRRVDSVTRLVDSVTTRVLQQLQASRPESPATNPSSGGGCSSKRSLDLTGLASLRSRNSLTAGGGQPNGQGTHPRAIPHTAMTMPRRTMRCSIDRAGASPGMSGSPMASISARAGSGLGVVHTTSSAQHPVTMGAQEGLLGPNVSRALPTPTDLKGAVTFPLASQSSPDESITTLLGTGPAPPLTVRVPGPGVPSTSSGKQQSAYTPLTFATPSGVAGAAWWASAGSPTHAGHGHSGGFVAQHQAGPFARQSSLTLAAGQATSEGGAPGVDPTSRDAPPVAGDVKGGSLAVGSEGVALGAERTARSSIHAPVNGPNAMAAFSTISNIAQQTWPRHMPRNPQD